MTVEQQIEYSQTRLGRIKLHFEAYKRDHKFRWHFAGIMREVMMK
ncbi:MAG: hypothetical protein ACYSR9_03550 [Planctomycetota bacterium]|jgi:hypothetical protein